VIVGSIDPTKKNFKLSLNIVDQEGKHPILQDIQERDVNLPENGPGNFNFIVEVINANFPQPGEYKVEIKIDAKVIGEVPFKVVENKLEAFGQPS
jgi:hypothetical protein